MNYERLASELFRALRGRRSQAAINRRLGYHANVAYSWEHGRRFPACRVLFQIGQLNQIPMGPLAHFADSTASNTFGKRVWSSQDTTLFLRKLVGEAPLVDIARAVGVDRTTVARWLRGATEPRVPEFLKLIDTMTHRLVEFVSLFVEPETLESLREISIKLAAQRRIAYELPWSHAVLRALELDGYRSMPRHTPGVLAKAIGVELSEETRLLTDLRAARLIRRKAYKWVPTEVLTVDTRANPERDRRLKAHWAEVGLERLRQVNGHTDALFSYNLFSVSHADFSRLRELHIEYFERVRRIVAESNQADRVVLLNQQLIPLDAQSER